MKQALVGIAAFAAALAAAGCAVDEKGEAAVPAPVDATVGVVAVAPTGPQDAQRTVQQFFELKIIQLAVPQGTISRNDTFWKPFDETFLGIWKHDVLHKNGLRAGRAPLTELAAIQNQLAEAERTNSQLVGTQAKDTEMEVRSGVERETIFAFNEKGQAEGRDFANVDNLFVLGFKQIARRNDRIWLSVVPAVREQDAKLVMQNEAPKWVKPTVLYEVGIELELGENECLVLAPSTVALDTSTSVGRTFMMEDRPASRVEIVLVVIPTIRRVLEEVLPVSR